MVIELHIQGLFFHLEALQIRHVALMLRLKHAHSFGPHGLDDADDRGLLLHLVGYLRTRVDFVCWDDEDSLRSLSRLR